jgi:hypothetical protein
MASLEAEMLEFIRRGLDHHAQSCPLAPKAILLNPGNHELFGWDELRSGSRPRSPTRSPSISRWSSRSVPARRVRATRPPDGATRRHGPGTGRPAAEQRASTISHRRLRCSRRAVTRASATARRRLGRAVVCDRSVT